MHISKRYFILIIIIVAIALRMFGSGIYSHPEYFSDEIGRITTGKYFAETGQPLLWQDTLGENILHFSHPPFDKLAYAMFYSFVGDGYALRLFPIAAGILTIILTFYLGKKLYNTNTGIVAAALMALSRYHIYASQLIDVDGSFLPLFATASILFFVIYKKKSDIYSSAVAARKYLLISMLFFGLCIFTKLLGALIIIPIILYSIQFDKSKRNFLTRDRRLIQKKHLIEVGYFFITGILVSLLIFSMALAYGNIEWFDGPINVLVRSAEGTAVSSLSTTIQNKVFFLSSIAWQMTPFLAMLVLLALAFVKKDEKWWLLMSWSIILLIIFLIPVHGDAQRYFTIALPAVFILASRFIFDVYKEIEERDLIHTALAAGIGVVIVAFLGVNDLMGYYDIFIPALLFLTAIVFMGVYLIKWKKLAVLLMVAGFVSMSLYAVSGTNSWIGIGTYTVHELSLGIQEKGWDYKQVWGWEDIIYQITPEDQIMVSRRPELNMEFITENSVKYIAVHTLRDENEFRVFEKFCKDSEFVKVNGHITGLLCEI